MTEAEWLTSEAWQPMLSFLSGRLTPRKAGLYVCAGIYHLWDLLFDEGSRKAVLIAERAADGASSYQELDEACYWAESPSFGSDFTAKFARRREEGEEDYSPSVRRLIEMGVFKECDLQVDGPLGEEKLRRSLVNAAHIACENLIIAHYNLGIVNWPGLSDRLLDLLNKQESWPGEWLVREIIGNPFHPLTIDPAWLTWNNCTISNMANAIYAERAFDRLPILSDALEEAGCTDAAILNHCRQLGNHVRGCWVVDLLLGKT